MTVESGLRDMRKCSTALHVLVRGGRWWQVEEAFSQLLSLGADTEAKDDTGLTPMAVALQSIKGAHFSLRAVEALLQAGVDPNAVDGQSRSCLSMAEDNDEVYRLLIRHMRTVTPSAMSEIIKRQDVALLAEVLANVVFMNAIGDATESERMVKLLLDHGADPSARYAKTTVMHQVVDRYRYRWPGAVFEGRGRPLKMMLQSPRFSLEHVDDSGMTVLHVAAVRRGTDSEDVGRSLVQVLLDAGANVLKAADDVAYLEVESATSAASLQPLQNWSWPPTMEARHLCIGPYVRARIWTTLMR
ncbi:hypothetical protein F5X68DRAFT_252304 [Plectosphaerella plurivora]|uniref:Ankyrin repeat protein n=1 Tax=Plectosphaerella plurivora TaxID=936078 RepID=A0A9P9AF76_9PEZI|nr:hypothetical protein F5X68DRAFT_252304 [Plectosphaerella plurivora]